MMELKYSNFTITDIRERSIYLYHLRVYSTISLTSMELKELNVQFFFFRIPNFFSKHVPSEALSSYVPAINVKKHNNIYPTF